MNKEYLTSNEFLIKIFIIILIISIGMFGVNQTLGYFYKSEFLLTPCELCLELNEGLSLCEDNPLEYDINNLSINKDFFKLIPEN